MKTYLKISLWILAILILCGAANAIYVIQPFGFTNYQYPNGSTYTIANVSVGILDYPTGNLIYMQNYTNRLINGSFAVTLNNSVPIVFNHLYYFNLSVDGVMVNFTDNLGNVDNKFLFQADRGTLNSSDVFLSTNDSFNGKYINDFIYDTTQNKANSSLFASCGSQGVTFLNLTTGNFTCGNFSTGGNVSSVIDFLNKNNFRNGTSQRVFTMPPYVIALKYSDLIEGKNSRFVMVVFNSTAGVQDVDGVLIRLVNATQINFLTSKRIGQGTYQIDTTFNSSGKYLGSVHILEHNVVYNSSFFGVVVYPNNQFFLVTWLQKVSDWLDSLFKA